MPKIKNLTEEEIKKMKRINKAVRNQKTNSNKYQKNKELIKSEPDAPRKCKNCDEWYTNKDFYASDMYNCKSCFKEKVNERRA